MAVIPAQAGIQCFQYVLDPGLRRGDENGTFYDAIFIDDLVKSLKTA